jgi:ubiquinone/menaquinone biosynthesis C-methylase UbiE
MNPYRDTQQPRRRPMSANSSARRQTPAQNQTTKTSWGKVADWYSELLEASGGTYQQEVILPNLMRLVAPSKGEAILDLASGQGFFSRELARAGAKVAGCDISPELVARAKTLSPSLKIDFRAAAAHETPFADDTFDKAICVLAIQNIHNANEALNEAGRVLKPQGSLHLVLNHPAYRIPQASSWGFDERAGVQFRRIDRYLSENKVEIKMHPGQTNSESTWSYHRPLQTYFKWLRASGFHIRNLEEWVSHRQSDPGTRSKAENFARKEFPLFMYLEAVKCDV